MFFISRSVLDLPLALSVSPFLLSHRIPNDAASLSTLRPLSRVNYDTFSPFFMDTGFPFLMTARVSVAGKISHSLNSFSPSSWTVA